MVSFSQIYVQSDDERLDSGRSQANNLVVVFASESSAKRSSYSSSSSSSSSLSSVWKYSLADVAATEAMVAFCFCCCLRCAACNRSCLLAVHGPARAFRSITLCFSRIFSRLGSEAAVHHHHQTTTTKTTTTRHTRDRERGIYILSMLISRLHICFVLLWVGN